MPQTKKLEKELQKHFHYPTFRVGQKEIIEDVLNGNDVLGILPTGSGKSICYQLPSLLLEGVTVVVSPLISLMMDQVKQLKAKQFKKAVTLNSFMNPEQKRRIIKNLHLYKLLYISPELLQQEEIINILQKLKTPLFVIDEAHCISQWGHEFRPDYLKLSNVIEKIGNPTVLALSATATPNVQDDIIASLNKSKMIKHIYPMDKPNIAFCVEKLKSDQEKNNKIIELLSAYHVPTLIYFSSRKMAEEVTSILSEELKNVRIAFYHAGMDPMDRIVIQQQFMNDQLDIICCTSAFGMGIDKSNIRLVIHYHFPLQIESFIQEVGRAGRDGKSSVSLLLFSNHDRNMPTNMIKNELPDETTLSSVFQYLYYLYQQKENLPKEEVRIENSLQINEVQWRFLRYQLEKHGMIKDNKIISYPKYWKDIYKSISHVINSRVKLKEKKLTEILKWIHGESCLRESLYKSFQSTKSEALYQCCSNCDFLWEKWEPIQTDYHLEINTSWKNRLQQIFLI